MISTTSILFLPVFLMAQEQAPLERSDERLVLGEHGLIDASRGPKEGV